MPDLIVQPGFSPNLGTKYLGLGAGNFGSVVHGFMEWDTPMPSYSGLAQVQFQFNPSTLAVAYYNQTASAGTVTDYIFSNPAETAPVFTYLQQSISFALLYDRTYELWGSYGSAGLPSRIAFPDQPGAVNDPGAAGVGVDIMAMQQITGMFATNDTGTGNATTSPVGSGTILKPQNPMIMWPTWVYFGNNPDGLYYFGYITDFEVQVTQWTQYMIPMRAVINVDFTLLPTAAAQSGQPAGPGLANWWSANPISGAPGSPAGGPGSTSLGVPTAGGIRG